MNHLAWIISPSVTLVAAGASMALAPTFQTGVYDEINRIVSLLVPIVAALLAPLIAAIGLLFRTLLSEMRSNREVVQANTQALISHTSAVTQLSDGISGINRRLDDLGDRIDRVEMDEGARRPRPPREGTSRHEQQHS